MTPRPSRFWLAAIVLLGTPLLVRAQGGGSAADLACAAASIYGEGGFPSDESPAVLAVHPLSVRERYAALVVSGAWPTVLDSIASLAFSAFVAAGVSDERIRAFGRAASEASRKLAAIGRMPRPDRLRALGEDQELLQGFAPERTIDGLSYEVAALGTMVSATEAKAVARAVCWASASVEAVVAAMEAPLQATGAQRIAKLDDSWMNFRRSSYARAPWEWLLAPGDRRRAEPPRRQWLVAHPSAGLEVTGSAADSLSSRAVAVFEFGVLVYRSDWQQYSGVSAIAATGTSGPLRLGALLHIARGIRAGYFFVGEPGVVVSADALQWLDATRARVDRAVEVGRSIVRLRGP